MRHAQVQNAQQSAPCHVFDVSQLYTLKCFEIVFTFYDTDPHDRGSCFPTVACCNTAPVGSPDALCVVGLGVLSWLSSPDPGPMAVSCQCPDSSCEPLLVDQPRNHDVPAQGVGWAVLLARQHCSPCGFVACCVRHVQSGLGLTRGPLYDAAEGA